MRTQTVVGVLLVVIGVIFLVFGGFSHTTTREAVKVGPVGITAQETKTFSIPRPVAGALVAGGVILLLAGARRP